MKTPPPSPSRSVAGDPIRVLANDEHAFARRLLESAGDDGIIPEAPLRRLAEALSVPSLASPASRAEGVLRASRWAGIRGYALSFAGLGVMGVLASQWPTRAESERAEVVQAAASQQPDAVSRPESAGHSPAASDAQATSVETLLAPPGPSTPENASAGSSATAPIDAPIDRRGGSQKPNRSARSAALREAPAADEASALTEELRALELAQRALRMGQVDGAERALAAYSRRFPRPTLAVEAELLEIDVLLARGTRTEAIARARALVARPGARRYRERLSELLHEQATLP